MLKLWARIAARIVPSGDGHILAGGVLPFSPEASTVLLDGIRESADKRHVQGGPPFDDDAPRKAAPLFTIAWLFDLLPKAIGETPA